MQKSPRLLTPRATEIPSDLYRDDNYLVLEVDDNWFSACRMGGGIAIHFASRNPRKAHQALERVCQWLLAAYPWCELLLATIKRRSVIRLASRCGFREVGVSDSGAVAMARAR